VGITGAREHAAHGKVACHAPPRLCMSLWIHELVVENAGRAMGYLLCGCGRVWTIAGCCPHRPQCIHRPVHTGGGKRSAHPRSPPACPQGCPHERWIRPHHLSTGLIHNLPHLSTELSTGMGEDGTTTHVNETDAQRTHPAGSFAQSGKLSTLFGRLSTVERCSLHPLARAADCPWQPIQPARAGRWSQST
jgi:hypothetical protein